MITDNKPFNTDAYFSGGAGIFIEYHDIVKPVYLYAIIKMILTKESFGLPIEIISNMSILSIIEWYVNRRWRNPLKCLDYANIIEINKLDDLLQSMILNDTSLYDISPPLNIERILSVYNKQHMSFPIYIYSEKEEPYIKEDCKKVFSGITIKYVFGDLKESIKKCDQNFTYIFSNIELAKNAAEILLGTCSHILVAGDYRYNYIDNKNTFKYDLKELAVSHPYIRTSITQAVDMNKLAVDFSKLNINEGG